MLRIFFLLTLLFRLGVGAFAEDKPLSFPRVPLTPAAEAAKQFEALDGFKMDLLAAEPLLTSPVTLDYDENGNAWVCEMRDYPFTDKSTDKPFADKSADKPLGRVRVLKDTDGDGDLDTSTIFAEELSWPTGLAFWKRGVFVCATPDIWYLKDTDGDGKADLREKWYTGFKKFNIQAVINNLRWGLDHKIYGAGGSNGGTIQNLKVPGTPPLPFGANDFRFDPVTGKFEKLSGGMRFGHTFDDFGNRFLCNIRNPVVHVVMDAEYLARNPFAAFKSALHDAALAGDTLPVYRLSPPESWRTLRAARWSFDAEGKLYPRSELVPDGYFTSASGVTIYRGAAYPEKYYGNAFLADVAGNLVHRQVLTPSGATFTAVRGDPNTEFVRSPDIWFRPVNFTNAPDGTLHVVDMYRETIEHPWSIPDDIKAALDLESGREAGRLWRLTPPNFKPIPAPNLGKATTAELVALLKNPNSWWRETAHRLLFERQDAAAIPLLKDLFPTLAKRSVQQEGQRPPDTVELSGLQALYSLEGLGALTDGLLLDALRAGGPHVQEHALRLSEPRRLKAAQEAFTVPLPLTPRLSFQLALTLGAENRLESQEILFEIARFHGDDPFIRMALLTSHSENAVLMLKHFVSQKDFLASKGVPAMLRSLAQIVGARAKPDELQMLFEELGRPGTEDAFWKQDVLLGLAEGVKRSAKLPGAALREFLPDATEKVLNDLIRQSQRTALDDTLESQARTEALGLLTLGEFAQVRDTYLAALGPKQPAELRLGAVRGLASFLEPAVPSLLLQGWSTYTPPMRAEIVEALLSRPERTKVLLEAIETKQIDASQVPNTRQGLLMRNPDEQIRDRAKALFASSLPGPRQEVLKSYQTALELKRDPKNGRAIFEKVCATCHKLEGKGYEVGPNLETVRHHPPNQLLGNILDPNREVSPAYIEYVVATVNGKSTSGQILSETATSLTLRRANDVQETILRQDIDELASTGKSLMPEGLEKNITPQEMADLLGYLTSRPKK